MVHNGGFKFKQVSTPPDWRWSIMADSSLSKCQPCLTGDGDRTADIFQSTLWRHLADVASPSSRGRTSSPNRVPSPSSPSRTPSSSYGEMNYLRRSLSRESSPRTPYFDHRVSSSPTTATSSSMTPSSARTPHVSSTTRRRDRVHRAFDRPLSSSTPGRRVYGDLSRCIVSH